jgi:threonine aldolase
MRDQPVRLRQFASDNYAGMCPAALAALQEANTGHAPAYGEDLWTARAADLIREIFATDCQVFFVFTGTAANSLAIASLARSYHSVICHQAAHLETDECGAPEFFSHGMKVLTADGPDGKLTPAAIERLTTCRGDLHYPRTHVVSLTNATELGTSYTPAEVGAIGATCRRLGLHLHLDGARLANALAFLDVAPADLTWRAGVEVLSLGGVKNGLAAGEAVVFFNVALAREFEYRCKQAGQLSSKMRFIAAPWVGLLRDGLWLRQAAHANAMARRLEAALRGLGVTVVYPCQANSVFAQFSPDLIVRLHERGWHFYCRPPWGASRLMCAWDTTPEDVDGFAADVARLRTDRGP